MSRRQFSQNEKLLSAILPGVVRDKGWRDKLELHSFIPHWKTLLDETTAAHTEPLKIVKGILWVEVENSAWLQQLQYQKMFMLESINGFLKNQKIDDIRFVLARDEVRGKNEGNELQFIPPSPEEVKAFEEQVSIIEDEETRERLVRLWYLTKACVRK